MQKEISQILCELINIPSYGHIDNDHAILRYLKENLSQCLEIIDVVGENGNTNLLVGINTSLSNVKNCLLLSGHIDTVMPSKQHTPVATIQNCNIKGLGATDMKAFFASVIYKLPNLLQNKQPIIFAITTDEEDDFYGIDALTAEIKKRNIEPSFAIIGEPTASNFSVANRGNSIFMSTMQGQACHSSTPESGINAITLSMKMVCEIERLNSEYRDSASLCVTVANGGSVATPNVVPDSCSIRFSIRTSDSMTLSKIKFKLKQKHDEISLESKTQLVNIFDIPPFEKRDNPYVKHLAEINNIAIAEQKFTTEAGVIQQAFPKSDIVIFGPGDPNCAHKPEEEININELKKYSKDLVEIIAGYSAFKEKNLDEKELQL